MLSLINAFVWTDYVDVTIVISIHLLHIVNNGNCNGNFTCRFSNVAEFLLILLYLILCDAPLITMLTVHNCIWMYVQKMISDNELSQMAGTIANVVQHDETCAVCRKCLIKWTILMTMA